MAIQSPQEIEVKALNELFKTYQTMDRCRPSSWIVYTDDWEKHRSYLHQVCHATMQDHDNNKGHDHLITGVPKSSDLDIRYIQFLIDGPFRAFSDNIALEKLDKNYFLRCTNLSKWPSNVIYNFCVASRVPIEHSSMLEPWKTLLDEGYDPTLAFLVAQCQDPNISSINNMWYKKPNAISYRNFNHFWFDPGSNWANIINGEMDPKGVSKGFYKVSPEKCRPCNSIWGTWTQEQRAKINKLTIDELSDFFELPIIKSKEVKVKLDVGIVEQAGAPIFEMGIEWPAVQELVGLVPNQNAINQFHFEPNWGFQPDQPDEPDNEAGLDEFFDDLEDDNDF